MREWGERLFLVWILFNSFTWVSQKPLSDFSVASGVERKPVDEGDEEVHRAEGKMG